MNSAAKYGLASLLPRGLAIVTALILTPVALSTIGTVNYAIWVMATQVPSLVVSPDFGLGQGVLNEVSAAYRQQTPLSSLARRLRGLERLLRVSAIFWLVIGTAGILSYGAIEGGDSQTDLVFALVIALVCFVAGIPASLWPRVLIAREIGHEAVLWEGFGRAVALGASLAVLIAHPSLPLLIVAYMLPTSLALWWNAAWTKRRLGLARRHDRVPLREAFVSNRGVIERGKYFVLMQIAFVVGTAIDPYLINSIAGAEFVSYFSILRRPFDPLPLTVSLFAIALWPIFGRILAARQHWRALRGAGLIATIGGAIVALAGVAIYALRDPVYGFIGADQVTPMDTDILWMILFFVSTTMTLVVNVYLNALDIVKTQAIVMLVSTTFIVLLKSAALTSIGIHGYVVASALSAAFMTLAPLFLLALVKTRRAVTSEQAR